LTVKPIQRIGLSTSHREKLSEALKGRPMPPEERKRRSETMKGRKLSPEHRERVVAARRARGKLTNEKQIEECLQIARARHRAAAQRSIDQWHADLAIAWHRPDMELFQDILKSRGRHSRRTKFDSKGEISHGFTRAGKVLWKFTAEKFTESWVPDQLTPDEDTSECES
jgi:hypothetical protein